MSDFYLCPECKRYFLPPPAGSFFDYWRTLTLKQRAAFILGVAFYALLGPIGVTLIERRAIKERHARGHAGEKRLVEVSP